MPLVRIPEPFDHPDWLLEVKYDGFRALAIIEGHTCRLVSRRGHVFTKFGLPATRYGHIGNAAHREAVRTPDPATGKKSLESVPTTANKDAQTAKAVND